MNHDEFVDLIQKYLHTDPATAERGARATLQALAERISPGARQRLAELLPAELVGPLAVEGPRQVFHLPEFYRRVSQHERVVEPIAEAHARATFAALGVALSPDQLADLTSELTPDFEPLLAEARTAREEAGRRRLTVDEFVERVARRAELDPPTARRATEVVLETLAERISGHEVDALEEWLPPDFRPPLERGREHSRGDGLPLTVDDFVTLVAEREGVSTAAARRHLRAEFTTLREAVPDREFAHLEAELPDGYLVLVPDP